MADSSEEKLFLPEVEVAFLKKLRSVFLNLKNYAFDEPNKIYFILTLCFLRIPILSSYFYLTKIDRLNKENEENEENEAKIYKIYKHFLKDYNAMKYYMARYTMVSNIQKINIIRKFLRQYEEKNKKNLIKRVELNQKLQENSDPEERITLFRERSRIYSKTHRIKRETEKYTTILLEYEEILNESRVNVEKYLSDIEFPPEQKSIEILIKIFSDFKPSILMTTFTLLYSYLIEGKSVSRLNFIFFENDQIGEADLEKLRNLLRGLKNFIEQENAVFHYFCIVNPKNILYKCLTAEITDTNFEMGCTLSLQIYSDILLNLKNKKNNFYLFSAKDSSANNKFGWSKKKLSKALERFNKGKPFVKEEADRLNRSEATYISRIAIPYSDVISDCKIPHCNLVLPGFRWIWIYYNKDYYATIARKLFGTMKNVDLLKLKTLQQVDTLRIYKSIGNVPVFIPNWLFLLIKFEFGIEQNLLIGKSLDEIFDLVRERIKYHSLRRGAVSNVSEIAEPLKYPSRAFSLLPERLASKRLLSEVAGIPKQEVENLQTVIPTPKWREFESYQKEQMRKFCSNPENYTVNEFLGFLYKLGLDRYFEQEMRDLITYPAETMLNEVKNFHEICRMIDPSLRWREFKSNQKEQIRDFCSRPRNYTVREFLGFLHELGLDRYFELEVRDLATYPAGTMLNEVVNFHEICRGVDQVMNLNLLAERLL